MIHMTKDDRAARPQSPSRRPAGPLVRYLDAAQGHINEESSPNHALRGILRRCFVVLSPE
jgi:hypothetical protein